MKYGRVVGEWWLCRDNGSVGAGDGGGGGAGAGVVVARAGRVAAGAEPVQREAAEAVAAAPLALAVRLPGEQQRRGIRPFGCLSG